MDKKTVQRINSLLHRIEEIQNDFRDVSYEEFASSSLLIRGTSFSIAQIGEILGKLEPVLKDKYPNIPWRYAKSMRNLIVHDYDNAKEAIIYQTAKNDIGIIKEIFITILDKE